MAKKKKRAARPKRKAARKAAPAPAPVRIVTVAAPKARRTKKAAGSVSDHLRAAKDLIAGGIAKLIVQQSNVTKKSDKRRIGKQIAAEKKRLRNPFSK